MEGKVRLPHSNRGSDRGAAEPSAHSTCHVVISDPVSSRENISAYIYFLTLNG
jgi:hypothetical protein